jgi:type IV pilus assembly protein PilY1
MADAGDHVQHDQRAGKAKLLSQIIGEMRASSSTPNRSAAEYLGKQFQRTDEGARCFCPARRMRACCSPMATSMKSGNTTLMKDSVAPYYKGPLVPSRRPIPCQCKPDARASPNPSLDCKTHLHMNFYGVTLGTQGKEFGVRYLPDPLRPWVLSPDPYVVKPNFPTTTQNLKPEAVDECGTRSMTPAVKWSTLRARPKSLQPCAASSATSPRAPRRPARVR